MKIYIYFYLFLIGYCSLQSQAYNAPESVVFDPIGQQYIVSFAGSKVLGMQADSSSPFAVFAEGLTSPKGMVIYDTVLYVTDVTNVKAYSLLSHAKIAEYSVPGAMFLNDIAADDLGYLYVSDMNAGKIILIDPIENKVETLLSTPYQSPNGLYWDTYGQLLYVVYFSSTKSPIQSIDVDTKEIKDVYKAEFTMLDGITMDYEGSVYVSSWATDSVYKFNSGFDNKPVAIPKKFTSPADIYFDEFNDLLVIPCMNINKVVYQDPGIVDEPFDIKLVTPAKGEKNVTPTPKFEWIGKPGISMYYISIYSVSGFTLNDSTDKTYYIPTEDLPNPDDFYWSVIGFNDDSIFSSDLWPFSTSGIIDNVWIENRATWLLYPNPAAAYIRIDADAGNGELQAGSGCIFNSLGTCVMTVDFTNDAYLPWIDISSLAPGVYTIRAGSYTAKFVKE